MLCARCGARNPDTVSHCRSCGTLLASVPSTPSLAHPWLAPIAHSPFGNEPLPQPSDQLPRLQPAGDILTFTSTPSSPNLELADYPTHVRVPAIPPSALTPNSASTQPPSQGGAPPNNSATPPQTLSPYAPADANAQPFTWAEDDSYAAMYQAPPGVHHAGPGSLHDAPTAAHVLEHDTPTISQSLGNVYPGPGDFHDVDRPQRGFSGFWEELEPHKFIQPISPWMFLGSIAAGILLLAGLIFLNPDWATGALIAGVVALTAAILLLIATGVRVALGLLAVTNPHRRVQLISTALLVLLLFLVSGVGMTQQSGFHGFQARYLESQHNWSTAINEYQAAGETAPASTNLARVYNEWGEDLSQQQHYAEAVAHFNTVLQNYIKAPTQLARVRKDLLATYLAWGDTDVQQHDYIDATSHYDALLSFQFCDSACQNVAKPRDATAYAHLAEQQLSTQHFVLAVNAFTVLTTRFASSPEAKQAQTHTDYAKALWDLGQQQLTTTCTSAVRTYQQLAQQFADTTQGQQAATALQQPVAVKGRFTTTLPHGAAYTPTVALVQGLFVGIQQFQFPPLLRRASLVHIQSDGTFTFPSIPQGTYELVWSNDGTLHFYYANSGKTVLYTAQVGPLCTYNYGAINETIPALPA